MRWRPPLRTLLLLVNCVILCLPLGGIAVLRLYESALIRQTESELLAQGAVLAVVYRAVLTRLAATAPVEPAVPADYGLPVAPEWWPAKPATSRWQPRPARLDLATDAIRPPLSDPLPSAQPADPLALAAGRELAPILRDAQVITLAGIRVLDYRGTIVASTEQAPGLSRLDSEEVVRALRGEPVSLLRSRLLDAPPPPLSSISRGSRLRVVVALPIVQDGRVWGVVELWRTPTTLTSTLYNQRYLLLQLALALLAVVVLLAVFTAFTISRPVQAVITQAQRAVRGETGAVTPLPHPVTREIAQLSTAVATMAQTLEQRADAIRTFATHVSHEFKTPLAAMQGTVELLRDHDSVMAVTERERFLDNLAGDVERLERLVRRLLALARADVMVMGTETADLNAVVADVVARYRRQGLPIHVDPAVGLLPKVTMSADTLDAILSHLLDNARQHGGQAVTVTVHLDTATGPRQPTQVVITIEDDGPGISPANAARIFEPFFTTARSQGGTGLGLTLVKALLAAHQGRIELVPATRGTTFRLGLQTMQRAVRQQP